MPCPAPGFLSPAPWGNLAGLLWSLTSLGSPLSPGRSQAFPTLAGTLPGTWDEWRGRAPTGGSEVQLCTNLLCSCTWVDPPTGKVSGLTSLRGVHTKAP